jgi:hypothetical protein
MDWWDATSAPKYPAPVTGKQGPDLFNYVGPTARPNFDSPTQTAAQPTQPAKTGKPIFDKAKASGPVTVLPNGQIVPQVADQLGMPKTVTQGGINYPTFPSASPREGLQSYEHVKGGLPGFGREGVRGLGSPLGLDPNKITDTTAQRKQIGAYAVSPEYQQYLKDNTDEKGNVISKAVAPAAEGLVPLQSMAVGMDAQGNQYTADGRIIGADGKVGNKVTDFTKARTYQLDPTQPEGGRYPTGVLGKVVPTNPNEPDLGQSNIMAAGGKYYKPGTPMVSGQEKAPGSVVDEYNNLVDRHKALIGSNDPKDMREMQSIERQLQGDVYSKASQLLDRYKVLKDSKSPNDTGERQTIERQLEALNQQKPAPASSGKMTQENQGWYYTKDPNSITPQDKQVLGSIEDKTRGLATKYKSLMQSNNPEDIKEMQRISTVMADLNAQKRNITGQMGASDVWNMLNKRPLAKDRPDITQHWIQPEQAPSPKAAPSFSASGSLEAPVPTAQPPKPVTQSPAVAPSVKATIPAISASNEIDTTPVNAQPQELPQQSPTPAAQEPQGNLYAYQNSSNAPFSVWANTRPTTEQLFAAQAQGRPLTPGRYQGMWSSLPGSEFSADKDRVATLNEKPYDPRTVMQRFLDEYDARGAAANPQPAAPPATPAAPQRTAPTQQPSYNKNLIAQSPAFLPVQEPSQAEYAGAFRNPPARSATPPGAKIITIRGYVPDGSGGVTNQGYYDANGQFVGVPLAAKPAQLGHAARSARTSNLD